MRNSMADIREIGDIFKGQSLAGKSDAIISGSAAFFAPEILMTPFSFWPPTIRIRSNEAPALSYEPGFLFAWRPALRGARFAVVSRLLSAIELLCLPASKIGPQCLRQTRALGGFARIRRRWALQNLWLPAPIDYYYWKCS